MDKEQLEDIIKYAKHIHVNAQDGTDYCKECRHWIGHPIHESEDSNDNN